MTNGEWFGIKSPIATKSPCPNAMSEIINSQGDGVLQKDVSAALEMCRTEMEDFLYLLQRAYLPIVLWNLAEKAAENPYELEAKTKAFFKNVSFYALNAVRFRDRKDIKYSISAMLSSMHSIGTPVLFVVRGTPKVLRIYFGIVGDDQESCRNEVEAALRGFLPGTETESCDVAECGELLNALSGAHVNVASLCGVPAEKVLYAEEKRNGAMEYGLERFVDAMNGEEYTLIVCAIPVDNAKAAAYFKNISALLDKVHPLAKENTQQSIAKNWSASYQKGTSRNETNGGAQVEGSSSSESFQERNCMPLRLLKTTVNYVIGGRTVYPQKTESRQTSTQTTYSRTFGVTESLTETRGDTQTESRSVEVINSMAAYAEEVLKMLQERLKNGMGEGMWQTSVFLLSEKARTVHKGAHMLTGMWSGGKSHQDPLRYIMLTDHEGLKNAPSPFYRAFPLVVCDNMRDHPLGAAYHSAGTWLSSSDLSYEMNLPYHPLPNLPVEKVVEYERFLPKEQDLLELGKMVDHNVRTDIPIHLDLRKLNRHLFVTGLTGAGKSNTIRAILLELARKNIPFLVIEPAKREYRTLRNRIREMYRNGETEFEDMDVFSLSDRNGRSEPMAMNPFAFEVPENGDRGTALVAHIDRLKSVFNSALGMYSSMPFILETIIYRAYENMGWNIETGENEHVERAMSLFKDVKYPERLREKLEVLFLPVLSDLKPLVEPALKSFFDGKSDYSISLSGALRSRLDSLTRGNKGAVLNAQISSPLHYADWGMLERPCVIELESFADNEEKAFIMALLLSRIYENRIASHHAREAGESLKHVLVIEEAHRLLSVPGKAGEHSTDGKGKSVEVFSDMLAEIRAYGQGIIIADQIPAKLIPDVMKNTEVKIAHRLTARDDREAVGAAMNLTKEQVEDLAKSVPGMATISYGGLNQAARIMMNEVSTMTTSGGTTSGRASSSLIMEAYKRDVFTWENSDYLCSRRTRFTELPEESDLMAALLCFFAVAEAPDSCWLYFSDVVESGLWVKDDRADFLWSAFAIDIHRWIERLRVDIYSKARSESRNADSEKIDPVCCVQACAQVSLLACCMAEAALKCAEAVKKENPEPLRGSLFVLKDELKKNRPDCPGETWYAAIKRIVLSERGERFVVPRILLNLGEMPHADAEIKESPSRAEVLSLCMEIREKNLGDEEVQETKNMVDLLQLPYRLRESRPEGILKNLRKYFEKKAWMILENCYPSYVEKIRLALGEDYEMSIWKNRLAALLRSESLYEVDGNVGLKYAMFMVANFEERNTAECNLFRQIRNEHFDVGE